MSDREFIRNIRHIPGWRTRRKIIVFESDDWGSIRMPSKQAFTVLERQGLDLTSGDSIRFNTYDTLASKEDLALLFEILSRYKDIHGSMVKFTALSVVANPDFEAIQKSGYNQYFYEPFTETLNRYFSDDSSFKLRMEGNRQGIFDIQFHGREHLN
ncbi:MAG: hypothetical protein K8R74_13930, partial [Bacteroidales bacterium]|nr:hypothetical protein [Bacteroidales bacterium]